jgi:hypothetical protein
MEINRQLTIDFHRQIRKSGGSWPIGKSMKIRRIMDDWKIDENPALFRILNIESIENIEIFLKILVVYKIFLIK